MPSKNKKHGRHAKTPGRSPASGPNSTTTSPSADFAGQSTALLASAARTSTPSLLPIALLPMTQDFMLRFLPAFAFPMVAMQNLKEGDIEKLKEMVAGVTGSRHGPMDSELETLRALAERELKEASDFSAEMKQRG